MIKGLYSGYQGKIYIFYRGPIQIVLSDVHAGFNMGEDLAATSLRIVLRPNSWTECAYSYVSEGFENHKGQLYALEQSGVVDIYTDPKDVETIKKAQAIKSSASAQNQATGVLQEQHPVEQPAKKKFFDMRMFTGENQETTPVVEKQEVVQTPVDKQTELFMKQVEAMTNMTNAFTEFLNKINKHLN